jgi:hypothetical protein
MQRVNGAPPRYQNIYEIIHDLILVEDVTKMIVGYLEYPGMINCREMKRFGNKFTRQYEKYVMKISEENKWLISVY